MENNKKTSIVVLVSGNGSNLQAIIDKVKSGELNVEIKAVISNKSDTYGLERAKMANIATEVFSYKDFQNNQNNKAETIRPSFAKATVGKHKEVGEKEVKELIRQRYCAELATLVKKYNPDLVVLAGWMLILKDEFLKEFPMRVMNLHPALIPAFPGSEGIKQAFDFGAKITGVTVHFVPDEGVDTGPVILQEPIRIEENDTLESLEAKIHAVEHQILPKAIQLFAEGRLKIDGRKVRIS